MYPAFITFFKMKRADICSYLTASF